MEMSLFQQQAWCLRVAAHASRMMAQTAALDGQRQQLWARTQAERLRLQQNMPEAHTWIIALTAAILVARDLDGYAPQGRKAEDRSRACERKGAGDDGGQLS